MTEEFDPENNYNNTKQEIGYVSLRRATQKDYDRIGFKSGLEVHQQLKTKKKLFCNCPAGLYNPKREYDAEIIRHMRPTLSELGEYDGTALMEFKTRKQIVYRRDLTFMQTEYRGRSPYHQETVFGRKHSHRIPKDRYFRGRRGDPAEEQKNQADPAQPGGRFLP